MENYDKHAFFAPSNLHLILKCPGAIMLADALYRQGTLVKGETNEAAEHGTMLHSYVPLAWKSKDVLQELSLNDRAQVQECLDYLKTIIKSFGHDNYWLFFEKQVSLRNFGLPEVWGTCDVILFDNVTQTLYIIDWKFGYWGVYAYNNPQLRAYAGGALEYCRAKEIEVHIVQPPRDNMTSERMSYMELYSWLHKDLAIGIEKCKQNTPEFIPGEAQCKFCPVKNFCDTRTRYVKEVAQQMFEAHKILPKLTSPEVITEFIKKAPLIEQTIKDFKKFVFEELQRGSNSFPDYKLVRGRANRKWVSEEKVLEFFEKQEMDEVFISKLISPAQAEKLNTKLKKDEEFQKLYTVPEGKLSLALSTDRRKAITPQRKAIDIFSEYASSDKLE